MIRTMSAKLDSVFKSAEQMFDKTLLSLPASAKLLAKIKSEYDSVLRKLQSSQERVAMLEVQYVLRTTHVTSMSNYFRRIQELEVQLEKVKVANRKVERKLEDMRLERETILAKYDEEARLMNQEQEKRSKIGTHQLKMAHADSLSINFLQDYLIKLEVALEEAKEVTEKKYITEEKRTWLQNRLKDKERQCKDLVSHNKTLSEMCRRLRIADQAVQSYLSYLKAHRLDQSQFPLDQYVRAVLAKQSEFESAASSSDEEAEDPVKEAEAEMILDAYEMFNKLFGAEKYQEAALHAATSPKGVLRTLETLDMFRDSARQQPGQKLPLLVYVHHLLQCAPAYQPISLQESIQCAQCLIQQGEVNRLTYWIAQSCLPASVDLGDLIASSCSCSVRCVCGFQNLAFKLFSQSRAYPQAAMCLLRQGAYIAFLSYSSKTHISREDYEELLHRLPSIEVALVLTCPPAPHKPVFTILDIMHTLVSKECSRKRGRMAQSCLHAYLKKTNFTLTECIAQDNRTKSAVWQELPSLLHACDQEDIALEIVSESLVLHVLSNSITQLQSEQVTFPPSLPRHQATSTSSSERSDSDSDITDEGEDCEEESSDEAESFI